MTLAGMIAVAVFAIWRGREPILRVLGAFVMVTAVAYVFTPLTAAGEQGQPIAFVWNLRYLAPAVAVALAILPCLPALRATPAAPRGGPGRADGACSPSRSARWSSGIRATSRGPSPRRARPGDRAGRLAPALTRRAGPAARERRVALAGSPLGVASPRATASRATTWRTATRTPAGQDLAGALRWARDIRGARIAVAGIRARVHPVPVLRRRPSQPGPMARCARPPRRLPADSQLSPMARGDQCRRLHARRHHLRPLPPGSMRSSPEGRWTESDPNAQVIRRDGPVRVFRLVGPLDPSGCRGQRPLTDAQLHSVPNLNDPGDSR